MNPETIGLVIVLVVICVAVIGWTVISSRQASLDLDRWARVAEAASQNKLLPDTAEAILSLLGREISAPSWAVYKYDEGHKSFDVVAMKGGIANQGKTPAAAFPLSHDTAEGSEIPNILPAGPQTQAVAVQAERGTAILNIPLGPVSAPAGLVQVFPVAASLLTPQLKRTFENLRQPLGAMLSASAVRDSEHSRLTDLESLSKAREALLESTFNAKRLTENTLGVLILSTQSSGAVVRLNSPAGSADGRAVEIYGGEAREMVAADPAAWKQVELALSSQTVLSRGAGPGGLMGALPADQVLSVPVDVHHQRAGTLVLARRGDQPYGPEQIRLVKALAEQLGRVMENERAYELAADTYRSTLRMLVELVDGRNPYSVGHSVRVARWAILIGQALGVSSDDVEALRWAALLHDVGMSGIGEDVLQTPGQLSEDELTRIRQHPRMGALICDPLQTPQPISPAIMHHHERWDGRGYPDHLAGEAIPLHARILSVAEVFNAIVSSRNYRKPKSFADAIDVVKSESGLSFDPRVVDAFVRAAEAEMKTFGGNPTDAAPAGSRCFEQKGTPTDLCSRCPAYMAAQACWSTPGVLCDYHGDRQCETCFIFTQTAWRSHLKGQPAPELHAAPRVAFGDVNARS